MAPSSEIQELHSRTRSSPKNVELAGMDSGHRSGRSTGSLRHVKNRKHRNSRVSSLSSSDCGVSDAHTEKSGKRKSSPSSSFDRGDIVWAKAFPYTWWPGRIDETKVCDALVSFFGCDVIRWFPVSEIRGFEDSYAQISKFAIRKLSDEISLALEELNRRATLDLTCPCREVYQEANDISANRISKLKKGFEPTEMLGFLLDIAVHAQFGDAKAATVARESAQFNAYRLFVSVGRNIDSNGDCHEVDLDDSSCIDAEKSTGIDNTESQDSQCNACQYNTWIGVISLSKESKGSDDEALVSSVESVMVCGVTNEPEDGLYEVLKDLVQEAREICTINRQDFSILDFDEEYESLLDNEPPAAPDRSVSAGLNICMDENLEKHTSQEPVAGATHEESFSPASDDYQNAANGIVICANEQFIDSATSCDANNMGKNVTNIWGSDHIVKSENGISLSNNLMASSETDMIKHHIKIEKTTPVECTTYNYAVLSLDSSLLKAEPGEDDQLLISVSSQSDIHSSDDKLEHSIEFQSSPMVSLVVGSGNADIEGTAAIVVSGLSIPEESESAQNGCDEAVAANINLMPTSETEMSQMTQQEYLETTIVGQETKDSVTVFVSKSDSCLKTAPCEEQLLLYPSSKCKTYSPDVKLKHSKKHSATFQSSSRIGLVVHSGNSGTTNIGSCLYPPAKMSSESVHKQCDRTGKCNDFFKLQKPLAPNPDSISFARPTLECQSSTHHRRLSNHEADTVTKDASSFFVNAAEYGGEMKSPPDDSIACRNDGKGGDNIKTSCNSNLLNSSSESLFQRRKRPDQSTYSHPSKWQKFYASPLVSDCSNSSSNTLKFLKSDRSRYFVKSLQMKFPKDFKLPSKEELEKKFSVFGPLECSKTKLYLNTGSGVVVFINEGDAYAAYSYVSKRNVFGQANVRFWLDKYEKYRKGHETQVLTDNHPSLNNESCAKELSIPIVGNSSLDRKSCTKALSSIPMVMGLSSLDHKSCSRDLSTSDSTPTLNSCLKRPNGSCLRSEMKKKCKVRFLMET